MKTIVLPSSTSNADTADQDHFYILQVNRGTLKLLKGRSLFFGLIPKVIAPTHMTWLGENMGNWVTAQILQQYLEFLGMEEIDIYDIQGPLVLEREQDDFYLSPAGKNRGPNVDQEQTVISNDGELYFDAHLDDGPDVLTTISVKIEDLYKAYYGEDYEG